jgi:hypothetical protein
VLYPPPHPVDGSEGSQADFDLGACSWSEPEDRLETLVISHVVAAAARSPQVVDAVSPFSDGQVSRDGSTAIADISYSAVPGSLSTFTTDTLQNAAQLGRNVGLTVEVGGALTPATPCYPRRRAACSSAASSLPPTWTAVWRPPQSRLATARERELMAPFSLVTEEEIWEQRLAGRRGLTPAMKSLPGSTSAPIPSAPTSTGP